MTGCDFSGLTEQECIQIQREPSPRIVQRSAIAPEEIRTAAGVDIAYWNENGAEHAVCCIVVIDRSRAVIEKRYSAGLVDFPYIPGCLAFRELPLVVETARKLESKPDIFMFDGNGILHPRGMGLAAHASFYLGAPTMGVAKHYFKVEGAEFTMPSRERGSFSDITSDGHILGRAVRTLDGVKPVYVSVGNHMDIETATRLALEFTDEESHIPAPTRYADLETHIMRSKLRNN